jgi:hypothetical protein
VTFGRIDRASERAISPGRVQAILRTFECQKQLSPKFVQVPETIGDIRLPLLELFMTFPHFIMPLVSSSSETIHFTVI